MALPRITSPHATGSNRTQQVMLQVLLATVPGIFALTWLFGIGTLFNLVWASLCALGFEAALLAARKRPLAFFLKDYSALVTAVLAYARNSSRGVPRSACKRISASSGNRL